VRGAGQKGKGPPARRGNLGAGGGLGRRAWLGAYAFPPRFLLWWGTPFSYAKRGSPPGPPSSKNVCAFMGRGCRPLVLGASPLAMSRPLRCQAAPAVRQGGEAAGGLLPFPLTGSRGPAREDAPLAKMGRGQGPRCWWAGGTGGGRLPRRSLALAPRNDKAGRGALDAACWWAGGPVGAGRGGVKPQGRGVRAGALRPAGPGS
jgi:hypothetical protein